MDTSIKELSYLLIDMVNGGLPTDDSKINYRVAKAYIKNAVAYQMRRKFFEDKAQSEENYIGKVTTKEVEVKQDDSGNYYVDTLGESVDLGGMRSYLISDSNPNSRWAKRYAPITLQEAFAQRTGLGYVPSTVQYYLEGDKLYFTNGDMEGVNVIKLSQANLLPSDDDDSVPAEVGQLALNDAYRLAYAEIVINTDRSNDGVSIN